MSIYAPSTNNSSFVPHVAGSFSAVLADMYVLEEVNYFHGKAGSDGKPDDRLTTHRLYLVFLTSNKQEDGKPSYIRQGISFSMGKNAKLTAILQGWVPELKGKDLYKHFDQRNGVSLETLLGKKAWIEVVHASKGEAVYANVDKILALPKFNPESGEPVEQVAIPADFKRADASKYQIKAWERVAEKFPQAAATMKAHIAKLQMEVAGDFMDGLQEPQGQIGTRQANTAGDIDGLPF